MVYKRSPPPPTQRPEPLESELGSPPNSDELVELPGIEEALGSPPNIELLDIDDLVDFKLTEDGLADLVWEVQDPVLHGGVLVTQEVPTENWTCTTTEVTTEVFVVCVGTTTVVTTTIGPRPTE